MIPRWTQWHQGSHGRCDPLDCTCGTSWAFAHWGSLLRHDPPVGLVLGINGLAVNVTGDGQLMEVLEREIPIPTIVAN